MLNTNIIRDYSINVYMSDVGKIINSRASFNQKDIKTSVLIVNLFNDKKIKKPIDLTNTTVIAEILKNDNNKSTIQCSIIDEKNGTIAIGFTQQSLLIVGDNMLELIIQSDEQISYSPKIIYTVIDNLFDESTNIESQTEFPILGNLINNVTTVNEKVEKMDVEITNNENVRNSNEQIRIDNEENREIIFNNNNILMNIKIENINDTIINSNKVIKDLVDNTNNLMSIINNEFDTTITNINKNVDDIINEFVIINNQFKDYVIDMKTCILSCKDEILKMKSISDEFIINENIRKENEIKRTDKFNNIIASLEINNKDIEDIINMVGGGIK